MQHLKPRTAVIRAAKVYKILLVCLLVYTTGTLFQQCGSEKQDAGGNAILCDFLCVTEEGADSCEWTCEDPEFEVACSECEYFCASGTCDFDCKRCDVGTY